MATTATYDPDLSEDLYWVRFLVGDRDVTPATNAVLDDEEIAALLVEERNKYLAAARAGEVIMAQGRDVISKAVDDLKLETAGDSPDSAYRAHLQRLRERGAEIQLPSGERAFTMLGSNTAGG